MIRALVTLLLVAVVAPAQAMSIATPYKPISRSEFIAEVLAIGLTQVSPDGFDSPAGYRLTLEGGSEFCTWGSLLRSGSFNGSFRLGDTIYRIYASADPEDGTFEDMRTIAAYSDGVEFTVALERISGRILQVTRSDPGRGLVLPSPPACRRAD